MITQALSSWQFWLAISQILFTFFGVALLKFNDFKHLTKKVDGLTELVKELSIICTNTKERISKIEGKLGL